MISGKILRDAIISGANNINNQRSRVDELNVFPVPDGDTGTNMGTLYELQYRVTLRDAQVPKAFLDALRCRNGNLNITCSREQTCEAL